jgi:hypothetical protein
MTYVILSTYSARALGFKKRPKEMEIVVGDYLKAK